MSSRSSSSVGESSGSIPASTSGSREGTYAEPVLEANGVKKEEIDSKKGIKVEVKEEIKEEDKDVVMDDATSPTLNGSLSEDAKSEPTDVKLETVKQKSVTPPLATSKSKVKVEPQLIGHLPRAEDDAFKTFEELPGNHYQYGTLGRSREALESMTCDCQYDHGQCSRILSSA